MKIKEIIHVARGFAAARQKLVTIVDRIKRAQQNALDENKTLLREAVRKANTIQAELVDSIQNNPELFAKPRTLVIDGVRVGLTTAKGKIEFDDADAVVAAIKSKLPKLADVLIATEEKPVKKALEGLDDDQLAKIGVQRTPDDPNAVVIKPTDSEVDKLVAALLKDVESHGKELVA